MDLGRNHGVTVVGLACHMMPGLGGGSRSENFKYRIPSAWSPENDNNYSFRAYMTDISLWVMLTDLAPHSSAQPSSCAWEDRLENSPG